MAHTTAKAFPLAWPAGQLRAKSRSKSKFGERTLAVAFSALKQELQRLGAQYIVISTNVPLKADGNPYSNPGRMPDPGVAAYFRLRDKPYALSVDRWLMVEENLYALAKHIEAMRGMERWGVGSVEQTFAGFKALGNDSTESWWSVLGVTEAATPSAIRDAHRAKALVHHPDRGGAPEKMQQINAARDLGLSIREVR